MPLLLSRVAGRWSAVLLVGTILWSSLGVPSPRIGAAEASAVRQPWTTSRVIGSPDPPPPYEIVQPFPKLKFDRPILLARCPGSDRLFVGEQAGVLYSFRQSPDAEADVFFDLRQELATLQKLPDAAGVEAVYGLVFHPEFATNRQCFICYTLRSKNSRVRNLPDGSRVSRFTVTETDPPRVDPNSEEIVLSFVQGGHNGGDLHFGPDGMLYISTGDAADPNPPDPRNTGQDIGDLLSSILRIDVNRRDADRDYGIPPDNPFVHLEGARPEVWAYGFRNPWRMSFDRQTGELYVGDVGWELWESVHRIDKGGNYGWSASEGPQPIKVDQLGPTPIHPALIELPHTIACSVTGGYVYRGRKFPELVGAYIFGDWETRRLWAARFDGSRTKEMPEMTRPAVRVSAFGENHDGELFFLDHDFGTVHTLARSSEGQRNADFPTSLSQTGLFASAAEHRPAAGVYPFVVNSQQWHDGATAEHWIALPDTSSVRWYPAGKPIPGLVYWHHFRMHFPRDTVLVRTIAAASRRIETQLLHYDGLDWRGYTYAWRDDQSDADLVPADGAEKDLRLGGRNVVWQFHSRTQCLSCHSNQSEYALAFSPEQLNRPGSDGHNQLVAFTQLGLIQRKGKNDEDLPAFDAESVSRERGLVDPANEREPLEARARAYLHANCGHCHSDHGGGTVPLRLQYSVPPQEMHAIGARPTRGDFSLPDAEIIKPGEPLASTLFFRMAKFGRDRMPHIGSEWPDEFGLRLIEQWIASLPRQDNGARVATSDELDLNSTASALHWARQLGRDALSADQRTVLLAAAAKLPVGPPRDLFEGFFPAAEQGERKLGSNPRPARILSLAGDAARGEQMFWSEAVNCGKCHRVGERGAAVGPELSSIGGQRTASDLLESMLTPSRRIEPQYAAYLVQTADGRLLTGVLVRRDDTQVILRDGQGLEITLAARSVQNLQPLRNSLMPDGQLSGLTAQQAADLLCYLTGLRGTLSPSQVGSR